MEKETAIMQDDDGFSYKNSLIPPIAQSAIFTFCGYDELAHYMYGSGEERGYGYTRGANPTVRLLEEKLAYLAHGEECVCVSSGEAAIALTLLSHLHQGDHLLCVSTVYSSAKKLIDEILVGSMGLEVTYVDGRTVQEFHDAIKENTKLIYLESPSSSLFQLQDIQGVCALARPRNIKVVIDNTYATMLYQKPLLLGADIELHSISKYLSGHNDVVAGAIIGSHNDILRIREKESILIGTTMSPFDAWLALRGLRTLPVRLKTQKENANQLAEILSAHEKIKKVYHVGLSTYEQKDLFKKQMSGSTGLFSIEVTTSKHNLRAFMDRLTLFKIGISWGGFESMVYLSSMNKQYYIEAGDDQLITVVIRINIGLENVLDLLNDITTALACL